MNDLIAELEQVRRSVGADGADHVVELRRSYDAAVDDVWDACTNPERVPRWFLPLTGDLRVGGRFQLEGNAGGEIRECDPPHRLAVTWEAGDQTSIVSLTLAEAGDTTDLYLRHAVPDDDHWAKFGPGAVGVGWDLVLAGLGKYLRSGGEPIPKDMPPADVLRGAARDWGAADVAAGTPAEVADEAAARCSAAYAP
jgi:uncharacterized protein YndB with AHSA1/START domain